VNESEESTEGCGEIADSGLASFVGAEYISTPFYLPSFRHFGYNPPSGVWWLHFMEEIT